MAVILNTAFPNVMFKVYHNILGILYLERSFYSLKLKMNPPEGFSRGFDVPLAAC